MQLSVVVFLGFGNTGRAVHWGIFREADGALLSDLITNLHTVLVGTFRP